MRLSSFLLGALAASWASAHPGHDVKQEAAERRAFLQNSPKRDLSHCAGKLKARGHEARSIQRRAERVGQLAKNGILKGRDISTLLNVSHASPKDYTPSTAETTIFAGNNSCVLSPEVTEGPYYVAGEYIRQNVTETQPGVPLTIDIQVVDISSCDPVEGVYLEIWHCNSTGVYSGVSARGNGNSDSDTSNLDATFLRGVQKTDSNGAVQFDTLFPGHYAGRTPHVHVMVHEASAKAAANGTLLDKTATHVGQMFFDQSLISEVSATAVYKANTQSLTLNSDDAILASEADGSDPFVEYVLLGDAVEDGLFAWLGFGVDLSASKTVSAAATIYETGGEAGSASGPSGGGPGGAPPNGTAVVGSGTGTATAGTGVVSTGSAVPTVSNSGAKRRFQLWM